MANKDNKQPLTPEQVDFEQKHQQKQELKNSGSITPHKRCRKNF